MDWLDDLNKIREDAEKLDKEVTDGLDLSILGRGKSEKPEFKKNLLIVVDAHNALRRLNQVLLGGKGLIDVFDSTKTFDYVIGVVWQGSVAKPLRPNPNNPGDYSFILVGCKADKVYVNGQVLDLNTPEALKQALVEAAKNPGKKP
jgi:hypothetical protein